MSAKELRRQLEQRARAEEFDLVGVAASERLDRDAQALAAWLRRGMHASMVWMARNPETRSDPGRLLEGCRSVVALAMNYRSEDPVTSAGSRTGKVARYGWGRDYHKILGSKLKRLAAWLESASGRPARAFVDTAPVLERAWSERAGLGWIGKNANLISREMGSWLLVGEIFTAAELEPDPGPHEDFCGSCAACIEACPSGAIVADGVVDSNLCIAYWTIEHRGGVPAPRRSSLGEWIFGCDICQEVCPWNERFERAVTDQRFGVREELTALDPQQILAMDEASFRAAFSGTSLMRARWDGMRRNACIVLGNRSRTDALPALSRAMEDEDALVRAHAAWALGRIGGDEARSRLQRAASRERSDEVRGEISEALSACGSVTEPE